MQTKPAMTRGEKTWLEVRLTAPPAQAEVAADVLVRLTGRGVQVEEGNSLQDPWRVTGYLEPGPEVEFQRRGLEELAADLARQAPGQVQLEFGELPEQDWHAAWKRHFHPRQAAPGLWVGPPWDPPQPPAGQQAVIIDPGAAFGTGLHPSTRLCLLRLVELARAGGLPESVLDVGCGSGILALAALRLGCHRAVGIDIDPLAREAARYNAALNHLQERFQVSERDLSALGERFPLVLANLTAAELEPLAGQLAARLTPGGELVASGILAEQEERMRAVFTAADLKIEACRQEGEWVAVVCRWPEEGP